jgi:hypothetical protein
MINQENHMYPKIISSYLFFDAHNYESIDQGELMPALHAAKEELATIVIVKDRKTSHYKYATLDAIIETTFPILAKHGLTIVQQIANNRLSTQLIHKSGQRLVSSSELKAFKGRNTNSVQDFGGAITYEQRYALRTLLCLATGEDNDAQTFKDKAPVKAIKAIKVDPAAQIEKLKAAITRGFEALKGAEELKEIKTLYAKLMSENKVSFDVCQRVLKRLADIKEAEAAKHIKQEAK